MSEPGFEETPEARRLEEVLRDVDPARAGAGVPRGARFQADLRAAFVGGGLKPKESEEARSLRGLDGRSAEPVIENLVKSVPPPAPARPEFQDELRGRFLRGELRAETAPRSVTRRRRAAPSAPSGPPVALRLVVGTLAAAAALFFLLRLSSDPDELPWRGLRTEGQGEVVLDGRKLVPRDLSEFGEAFAGARVIQSQERRLELVHQEELVLAMLPGTHLERVGDPAANPDEMRFSLLEGEVFLKTNPGYTGPSVVIETDDMEMRMVGTVVGVLKKPELSCVCVARGTVDVHTLGRAVPTPCSGGNRLVVFEGGREFPCPLDLGDQATKDDMEHVGVLESFALESFGLESR